MAKIKVLFLLDHLGCGGAQRSCINIAEHLSADVEPVICTLRDVPDELSTDVPRCSLGGSRFGILSPISLLGLCRKVRPDVIHSQQAKSNITAMAIKNRAGIPLIVHERGNFSMHRRLLWIYRKLFCSLASRADVLLANSSYTAQLCRECLNGRSIDLRLVYNAVDFPKLQRGRLSPAQVRQRLGIEDDVFLAGYVGRLHKLKGLDILIDAMAHLAHNSRCFKLCIVGHGPELPNLQRQVQSLGLTEKVIFAGQYDNIARIVPAFDVAVVPSRQEAFGRAALELMYLGVPVIASAVGGLKELVLDGKTGLLVGEPEPRAYALAIMRLFEDAPLRERLARDGHQFSLNFSIERHSAQLEKLYMELAQKYKKQLDG